MLLRMFLQGKLLNAFSRVSGADIINVFIFFKGSFINKQETYEYLGQRLAKARSKNGIIQPSICFCFVFLHSTFTFIDSFLLWRSPHPWGVALSLFHRHGFTSRARRRVCSSGGTTCSDAEALQDSLTQTHTANEKRNVPVRL